MNDPSFPSQWRELVDVLLVSYFVHRLIQLFRGTAAQQIVTWFVALVAVQWLARAADLELTSWLLQWSGPVAALVFVVVFRHEIREVLLQTSPIRLFLGRQTRAVGVELVALAEAAFGLAETRTGALIVFRNRDRLTTHAREGVALGGIASPQILASIFAKESPVHDGAAIVHGNRIERVGTFLPLTIREGLPAEFGTRHRAAIGLSERTDAVVVVVSEERGEVSVVHRGDVRIVRSSDMLVDILKQTWRSGTEGRLLRRRLRSVLRQAGSFAAVVASVGLLWWSYSGQHSQTNVRTRVDYRNLPADLELIRPSVESVEVQVAGKRLLIGSLTTDQVKVFIDLANARPGYTPRYPLDADNVELPPGLQLVAIDPPTIALDLEERIRRPVEVTPLLVGSSFASGEIVVTVHPGRLTVEGPASDVDRIRTASTRSVDLTGLTLAELPRSFAVEPVIRPATVRLAPGQPSRVRVTVAPAPKPDAGEATTKGTKAPPVPPSQDNREGSG